MRRKKHNPINKIVAARSKRILEGWAWTTPHVRRSSLSESDNRILTNELRRRDVKIGNLKERVRDLEDHVKDILSDR